MTLERGSLLNKRYRIVEILGQGGMAAVYRAIDENLGLEVAVKENLFTTEEYARQFRREAVILANLRHPNLPRVTDHFVVEQQGQYLVMDYIEGEDLRQRMERQGALPESEVVIIGVALCEALTYMHTRKPQVLHRDIKPGNVKISPHGQIYLVDFGLAKVVQGRQATTTGARAMTPGYSPPEQYGTARTDHRTDIYSVGATLYSALSDIIPEDGLARAMEQMTLTPLVRRSPRVSKRLAAVIEKAMAVRPDDRYQSAEDLRRELLNSRTATRRKNPVELTVDPPPGGTDTPPVPIETESSASDQPGEGNLSNSFAVSSTIGDEPFPQVSFPKKKKNRPAMLLLLLLLTLVSLGVVALLNPTGANVLLAPFNLSIPTRVFAWTGVQATPTLDQTRQLAQTQMPLASPSLPTLPAATATLPPTPTFTPTPTEIVSPTPTLIPTSVGGGVGQIAFASDRSGVPEIWIMHADGTGLRQITDIAEGACQPDWHPDGNMVVFISPCAKNMDSYPGSSMFIIQKDGKGLLPLSGLPGGDYDPAWSPDGKMIVFTSLRDAGIPHIYILNVADGTVTLLSEDLTRANTHPSWSPDGKYVAYTGHDNQIRVVQKDGQGRFLLSRNASTYTNLDPIWSPDGQVLVFSQVRADLSSSWLSAVQFSLDGAVPSKIPGTDFIVEPDYSPDGFWLVVTAYFDGNREIYVMNSSGINRQRLTENEFSDFDPAWNPLAAQQP